MASRGGGKQDPINSFQSPSPAFLFFFVFFSSSAVSPNPSAGVLIFYGYSWFGNRGEAEGELELARLHMMNALALLLSPSGEIISWVSVSEAPS